MGTRVYNSTSALLSYSLFIRATLIFGIPFLYVAYKSGYSNHWTGQTAHGRRLLSKFEDKASFERNCTPAAILDFPEDLFTDEQRQQGAVALHALLAIYLFALLAVTCDQYFVPAIEKIVQVLQVSDDVGGATLMAAATSSPELFINVVGTFVTEGDLGVGAVLGSAVFNILAVPAFCGIFANKEIMLDWWPMSRDCGVYVLSVIGLIVCLADGMVFWYEALALVIFYFFYIILMYYNVPVSAWARRVCTCWSRDEDPEETDPLLLPQHRDKHDPLHLPHHHDKTNKQQNNTSPRGSDNPSLSNSWGELTWWKVITSPIRILLWLTIPDCRKHSNLYPVTFIMCIAWIGGATYLITWMITVIGDALRIPDSVMGITFLAAGTSVPEAVSSVIVTRQGHGGMGISNSIGSNTFDILLCLGLPWLIKSSMLTLAPATPPGSDLETEHRAVMINSHGLKYSAISLLSSTLLLYVTFSFYNFRLNKKVGVACLVLYAVFLAFASTLELNVFFVVNLPTCGR